MIEAGFIFPSSARRLALSTFLNLPGALRPTRMSMDERDKGRIIGDHDKFLDAADKRDIGFSLIGPEVEYDISFAGPKPIRCICYLDINPQLVTSLLVYIAAAQPSFGFACDRAERERLNRVTRQIGINRIESWVGRDIERYVPGLYWLTLLPAALAETHRLPLSALDPVAREHIDLGGGQHLFRFYDRPEDWEAATDVNALRSALPGLFKVEAIKPLLEKPKNVLDYMDLTSHWP